MTRDEVASAYEAYGAVLHRRAVRWLGSDEEASDVLQDVFCAFWTARDRFRGESALFTFLYRMTTNKCIDRLRQRSRRGDTLPLLERDAAKDAAQGHRVESREMLAIATTGLPDAVVETAVLVYVEGFTQEEAADFLSISRRAVAKRLARFKSVGGSNWEAANESA